MLKVDPKRSWRQLLKQCGSAGAAWAWMGVNQGGGVVKIRAVGRNDGAIEVLQPDVHRGLGGIRCVCRGRRVNGEARRGGCIVVNIPSDVGYATMAGSATRPAPLPAPDPAPEAAEVGAEAAEEVAEAAESAGALLAAAVAGASFLKSGSSMWAKAHSCASATLLFSHPGADLHAVGSRNPMPTSIITISCPRGKEKQGEEVLMVERRPPWNASCGETAVR